MSSSILTTIPLSEENRQMPRKVYPLPPAIIPFILANLEGFDVVLEGEDRIVITPKEGAEVKPASRAFLKDALLQKSSNGAAPPTRSLLVVANPPNPPLRPKFLYRVKNASHTPEQAKAFGLSKPRLEIYRIIHASAERGVDYKAIREKSKMPHGSVQQILNWLRKQKLVTATQITA